MNREVEKKNFSLNFTFEDTLLFFAYLLLMKPYFAILFPLVSRLWNYVIILICIASMIIYVFHRLNYRNKGCIDSLILFLAIFVFLNDLSKGIIYNGNVRGFVIQMSCMMLTVVRIEKRPIKTVNIINLVLILYFVINMISIILFPNGIIQEKNMYDLDIQYWFLGNKNPVCRSIITTLGFNCFTSFLIRKKMQVKDYVLIVFSLGLVLYLKSVTVIVAIAFIMLMIFISDKVLESKKFNLFNIFLACGTMSFLLIFMQANIGFLKFVEYLGKDMTFSGRTTIWLRAVNSLSGHFVQGFGLAKPDFFYSTIGASHSHNYYLQTMMNGGIMELIIIGVIFWHISNKLHKNMRLGTNRMGFALLASFCIIGFAESLTQMPMYFAFFIVFDYFASESIRYESLVKLNNGSILRLLHRSQSD